MNKTLCQNVVHHTLNPKKGCEVHNSSYFAISITHSVYGHLISFSCFCHGNHHLNHQYHNLLKNIALNENKISIFIFYYILNIIEYASRHVVI